MLQQLRREDAAPFDAQAFARDLQGLRAELAPSAGTARGEADAPASELVARLAGRAPPTARLEIQGEIARGGMGVILRAFDPDLRRTLAMKVALERGGGGARERERTARFLDEAQITGQLDHPGIVPVHELGIDAEGRPYFTMRLVRGRDLGAIYALARRREEGWSMPRVLGVLLKVCEALAFAHSRGVIHRDLKPTNVMVGPFGEVYVMDWGLAKVLGTEDKRDLRVRDPGSEGVSAVSSLRADERIAIGETPLETVDGTVLGTPSFMSPEQAAGHVDRMDARSDVYALGAMLYELLAGHAPYMEGSTRLAPRALWLRVASGPPEPLARVATDAPPELVAIAERAMQRDMSGRYPDVSALADDLRAWLEGRVVHAYERGAWPELRKWIGRNRPLAAACAVALTAIVGGAAWIARMQMRGRTDLRLTADGYVPAFLGDELGRLTIAHAGSVARIEAWLAVARDLATRRAEHEARLRGLDRADLAQDPVAEVDRDRLRRLVDGLAELSEPDGGRIAYAESRLQAAIRVRERSIGSREASERWRAAAQAIADAARTPAYGGLTVAPQYGLVPLGPDPESGLWEFAHLASGEPPERDAEGRLAVTESTGVVLVLLPGGTCRIGEQGSEPSGANYFAGASENNAPPREVDLAAFFLSKYELTQGQWQRATGSNPSRFDAAWFASSDTPDARAPIHPVEQVSWSDCERVLAELGLAMPTEAQWEYGARAGTQSTWWTGDDRETLRGAANLADRSVLRLDSTDVALRAAGDWPDFEDGYPRTAPVDSFRPNRFGLHCVVGNVWEWCSDPWGELTAALRHGDGYRPGPADADVVARGGSFESSAAGARHANRGQAPRRQVHYVMGVRPVRPIDGRASG